MDIHTIIFRSAIGEIYDIDFITSQELRTELESIYNPNGREGVGIDVAKPQRDTIVMGYWFNGRHDLSFKIKALKYYHDKDLFLDAGLIECIPQYWWIPEHIINTHP